MRVILLILVLLLLFGSFPVYPYNRAWGYRPFSGIGVLLLVLILLLLFGVI